MIAVAVALLPLGEAAALLRFSASKMRQLVDAGQVEVDGRVFPLRSVRVPTATPTGVGPDYRHRKVNADDVAAIAEAIYGRPP